MAKTTSNGLTNVLNGVTMKTDYKYDKKDLSAFVLMLFMSEERSLQNIVANINPYVYTLPDELVYKYFVGTVPKGRRFMKFTKKTAESKERFEKAAKMSEELGISKREALLSM